MQALRTIFFICGPAVLIGCATNRTGAEPNIVPIMKVRHANESASGYYALGRYFHGGRRFDEAMKAYQRALDLEPGHMQTRNAMAALHAERGDYAQAILVLRDVTEATPDAGYLFSNLGYIHFLKGDYDRAAAALTKATVLDPGNARAWNNLGRTLEKMGQPERAGAMFRQAQSVERQRSSASANGLPVFGLLNEREQASAKATRPDELASADITLLVQGHASENMSTQEHPHTEVKRVGPNMYEIVRTASLHDRNAPQAIVVHATPSETPAPPVVVAATYSVATTPLPLHGMAHAGLVPSRSTVRLEVSNGNGVNGMAKFVGKMIGGPAFRVVRLTNQRSFDIKATRIDYRDGFEQAAQRLAETLGQPVAVHYNKAGIGSDLRLVIGKDMANREVLRAQLSRRLQLAEQKVDN